MTNNLWELLVPCNFGDSNNPIRTVHHKEFDKFVLKITTGLTVLKPATTGYWINEGKTYLDRVIPVRIACKESEIRKIALFAKSHYRQLAIMYYKISDQVYFV